MQRNTMLASIALTLALSACTGVIGQSSIDDEEQGIGGAAGLGGAGGMIGTTSNATSSSSGGGTSNTSGGPASSSSGSTSASSSSSVASSSSSVASSSSSSVASSSSSSVASSSSGSVDPVCGNLTCEMGESCTNCPSDCGLGSGAATTGLDSEELAFVTLINQHRAANNLGPLKACTTLNRAAQGHSEDMRDQDYFSHTGLNGSKFTERACDACYSLACPLQTAMGENIAAGNSAAQGTFTQWKNSAGHNANMLSGNYSYMGIGRALGGGTYGSYWTNVFGGASDGTCN